MMKKLLISLLSVGMLLGIFGVVGNNTNAPNVIEETVQADSTSNSKTINYEVYKENSNTLSPMNTLFTKSATITPNDDGTYKVTLTGRNSNLSDFDVTTIDGQTPKVITGSNNHKDISFNIASLEDLDKDIPATVQTKVLNINVDQQNVTFKFDSSSMYTQGANSSFADSLNKLTHAENDITNGVNNAKSIVSGLQANDANDNIISTPSNDSSTSSTTDSKTTATKVDPKTILKELTYSIAKNNGDGSLISPYFTNTAKLMQNPDGSYYVEATIKYPKKFGTNAFEINSINNQKPFNISFRSEGDSNYITFDFPIKKITDLSDLIPGNITMNIPDFGLNKDLGFNLNFDSLNPSDLSSLMSGTDTSGMSDLISSLGNISNLGDVKPTTDTKSNTAAKQSTSTLPQTGNEANGIVAAIGVLVLILTLVLLKGTYLKKS
ncbi:NEAT domain-containing protein [Companilactobacillus huachuanensis]|uniref:NEAT domain-containing protein n=1 Tax=Companilactobacillus huachuanensis TaxID=2559914 RepID=A0ABW1RPM3_9LACO|nr:NEAT domain-containing protein [Companilactobacillus huachuanensis]